MIRIRKIDHVALRVDVLDATAQFYVEVLNLAPAPTPAMGPELPEQLSTLVDRAGGEAPSGIAWLNVGASQIHLIAAPPRAAPGASPFGSHLALEVEDYDEARSDIVARSIPFIEGPDGGAVRQLWIADPSGNTIELWWKRPS